MRGIFAVAIVTAVIVVVPSAQGKTVRCVTVTPAVIKSILGIAVGPTRVLIDTPSEVNCMWLPRQRSGIVGVSVLANTTRQNFAFERKRAGGKHPPKALRALGLPAFAFVRRSGHTAKSNVFVLKGSIELSVFGPVQTVKTIALAKKILRAL